MSESKRKFTRKSPKRYDLVRFETSVFDGEFELPDQRHFTLGIAEALNRGDVGKLVAWLTHECGTDAETIEAIRDLEVGEMEEFISDWGRGSVIGTPKSAD